MMPVPEHIRVKLSSEAAGSVSLTPVVVQELLFAELLAVIMTATSEEPARLQEILKRGSIVSGATRYRWDPVLLALDELANVVAALPRSDPSLRFRSEECVRVVVHAGSIRIPIARDAAQKRKLLRRSSFWDAVLALTASSAPEYVRYIHRDKEDHYSLILDSSSAQSLQRAAALLKYAPLANKMAQLPAERIDLFVIRR